MEHLDVKESVSAPGDSREPAREFFYLGPHYRNARHGLTMVNRSMFDACLAAHRLRGGVSSYYSLPDLGEAPRFVYDRRHGGWPKDLDLYGSFWLMSDRLKQAFDRFDPDAAQFVRSEVFVLQGDVEVPGPAPVWIVSVLREALVDEKQSVNLRIVHASVGQRATRKIYEIVASTQMVFDEASVGEGHVFRTPYSAQVFCDEALKTMLRTGGFSGWRARSCIYRRQLPPPEKIRTGATAEI